VQHRLLLVVYNFLQSLFGALAKVWPLFWKAAIAASVVVGLVSGALFLFPPKLTVDLLGDPSDAYATSFVIKNSWVLGMRDVTPFLEICKLELSFPKTTINGDCAHRGAVRAIHPNWTPRYLGVDESFTEKIASVFNIPSRSFAGGDIGFGATFKAWYLPFTFERMFRFVAQQQQDRSYRWVPEAFDAK
jgi:hypothetical protein